MRVGIDDAGGHHQTGGVELDLGRFVHLPDGHDAALADAHVGPARRAARAVDERAGTDGVIEHGTSGGERRAPGLRRRI